MEPRPRRRLGWCGCREAGVLAVSVSFLAVVALSLTSDTRRPESAVDVCDLVGEAIAAVESGGRQVVRVYDSASLGVSVKGPDVGGAKNVVTRADSESQWVIAERFRRAWSLGIVGEEKLEGRGVDASAPPVPPAGPPRACRGRLVPRGDITLWVDPLDATKEYTEGLGEFVTVMACVAVGGRPVAGVIHRPFASPPDTTWAVSAGPARSSFGGPLAPPARPHSPGPRGIVSRSHAERVAAVAAAAGIRVQSAGGSGFKALAVANGTADVYLHTGRIRKWDICAGHAVLAALGGDLTGLRGEQVDYSDPSGDPSKETWTKGVVASLHHHRAYLERLQGALDA